MAPHKFVKPYYLRLIPGILLIIAGFTVVSSSCNWIKPDKTEVAIAMDDSVLLSTDIFIPNRWGKYATILIRTPYNKGIESWVGDAFGIMGIAVVVQDVRGKYKSGGAYYPFINERADGMRTLEWIRAQPWSNGVVGGWGTSYAGFTQWAVSDALDYMVPLLGGADLYDFMYPDGLFSLQSAFLWGLVNASPNSNKLPPEDLKHSMQILPLSTADDSTLHDIPFINDWLAHESKDEYWTQMNHRGIARASVLCIAGWYDIFLKTQIEDFKALNSNNPDNRMIIGPWCHGPQGFENKYGGEDKTGNPRKIFTYTVKKLKGKKNKLPSPLTDKKYNLFIMERNEYFGSDEWPPAETRMTSYYVGPNKKLGKELTDSKGQLTFKYDPMDPYPSFGGTALGDKVGPAMQNENLDRGDQLSFETVIFDEPLVLLGPISASLWLSSDAPCTDFIVCLQDVFPDGKIINIQEGGIKVHFTDDMPAKHEISVWATGYQLNPGHKIRVVITSSWFPRFNRNLNDCAPIAEALSPKTAWQAVHYGPGTSSHIDLPILELEKK